MNCPHCGTANPPENRTCLHCAKPLSDAAHTTLSATAPASDVPATALDPTASFAAAPDGQTSQTRQANTTTPNTTPDYSASNNSIPDVLALSPTSELFTNVPPTPNDFSASATVGHAAQPNIEHAAQPNAAASESLAFGVVPVAPDAVPNGASSVVPVAPGVVPVAPGAASSVGNAVGPSVEYKPSGKMEPNASLLLGLAALVGGPLVGALYSFVAQWINLLLVSQLAAGGLLGVLFALAVRKAKIRNPRATIPWALGGALLLYSTFLFCNSQKMRAQLLHEFDSQPELRQIVAQSVSPVRAFGVYIRGLGKNGTTLTSTHSGSSAGGIPIKGAWYWALLTLEIGVTCLTAAGIAQSAAGARFCEACDEWWKDETIHKVHPNQSEAMLERAQAGDWQGMKSLPIDPKKKPDDKNYCSARISRCPKCSDATILVVNTVKGVPKTLLQSRLDPQAVQNLPVK